jgi:hypothetical protein
MLWYNGAKHNEQKSLRGKQVEIKPPRQVYQFRHPLRNDARGRTGLKMRRGLGTSDEAEAEAIVGEMNVILADQSWWNAAKRKEAALRFSEPIIEAFYDEIQAGRTDPETLRESHIRVPGKEDGFPPVLFVEPRGRQDLATPATDRVRSRRRPFPLNRTRQNHDCRHRGNSNRGNLRSGGHILHNSSRNFKLRQISRNVSPTPHWQFSKMLKVADSFLSHRDQKFRLSYILGGWRTGGGDDEPDEMSFEDGLDLALVVEDESGLTDADRAVNRETISNYLDRIGRLTKSVVVKLTDDLGVDIKIASPDRDVAQQLVEENFESYLTQEEGFHELVQDIHDEVHTRFDFIDAGQLQRRPSGWPELWIFSSTDRDEFIRHNPSH